MSNSALQNMVDQIHQPTHTPVAIEAIDLVKDYGTGESLVHALKDVNVQFEQGRFTAIMGPSGSGKSTLMHVMSGLDSATSGSVVFQGRDLTKLNASSSRCCAATTSVSSSKASICCRCSRPSRTS